MGSVTFLSEVSWCLTEHSGRGSSLGSELPWVVLSESMVKMCNPALFPFETFPGVWEVLFYSLKQRKWNRCKIWQYFSICFIPNPCCLIGEVTAPEQKAVINQCLECSPEGKEQSRCEVWVIILFLQCVGGCKALMLKWNYVYFGGTELSCLN